MRWLGLIVALLLPGVLVSCGSVGSTGDGDQQLVGPTWQLESLRTAEGESIPRGDLAAGNVTEESFTLAFREDGGFGGTADCNAYGGEFANQNGSRLSLDSLVSTEELCGEQSQEERYLSRLLDVDGYEFRGDVLYLSSEGKTILRYDQVE